MNPIKIVYVLLFMLLITGGCSVTDGGRQVDTFVVKVDSVEVPSEVNASDTLAIRPFGTVGPNGCHSFKQFEASRKPSSLHLKVIGTVVEGEGIACSSAIVVLDTVYRAVPPLEGPFEINIQQPDGSVLKRTVEVTE